MRIKLALIFLMTASSVPGAAVLAAQQDATLDTEWSALTEFWRTTMDDSGVVGSSLLILKDGAVEKSAYYGFADRETSRAVDAETIYHWASITKTFTGIAVMQLRDRGLLNLDDPILDYIPELSAVHNPFGSMRAVTLRHLMSHSSGFRNPTWPWGGSEDWHPHEPREWEQLVAMFPYTEILFEPGSQVSYSNPGIIFLGRVIELLTGEDYEVYMEKNVLRPLGMGRSYFDHTPYHLVPYRSNNYIVTNDDVRANGLDFDTGITVSNGGLNAPVTDMARYLSFLSGDVDENTPAGRVLSRNSLEEMWQTQLPMESDGDASNSMGLLFFILDVDGQRVIGHTGSQQGFRSFIYLNPMSGVATMAVFNTTVYIRSENGSLSVDDAGFIDIRARILRQIFPLLAKS